MSEFDFDELLNTVSKEIGYETVVSVPEEKKNLEKKTNQIEENVLNVNKSEKIDNNQNNLSIKEKRKLGLFKSFKEEFWASVEEDLLNLKLIESNKTDINKNKNIQKVNSSTKSKKNKTKELLSEEGAINVSKENLGNNIALIRGIEAKTNISSDELLKNAIVTAYKKCYQNDNVPDEVIEKIQMNINTAQMEIANSSLAPLYTLVPSPTGFSERRKNDFIDPFQSTIFIEETNKKIIEAKAYISKTNIINPNINLFQQQFETGTYCYPSEKKIDEDKGKNISYNIDIFNTNTSLNDLLFLMNIQPSYMNFEHNKVFSSKIVEYSSSEFYKKYIKKFVTEEEKWRQKHANHLAKIEAKKQAIKEGIIKPRITLYSLRNSKELQMEQASNPTSFEKRLKELLEKRKEENEKYAKEHRLTPEQILEKRKHLFDNLDETTKNGVRSTSFAIASNSLIDELFINNNEATYKNDKNDKIELQTIGHKLRLKLAKAAQDCRLAGGFFQFQSIKTQNINGKDIKKYIYIIVVEGSSYAVCKYIHSIQNFITNNKLNIVRFIDLFDTIKEKIDNNFINLSQKWFFIKNYKSDIEQFLNSKWGGFSLTIADFLSYFLSKIELN